MIKMHLIETTPWDPDSCKISQVLICTPALVRIWKVFIGVLK